MSVQIDRNRCIRCQHCIRVCPLGALWADAPRTDPQIRPENCIDCGHCAAVCPTDAITLSDLTICLLPAPEAKQERADATESAAAETVVGSQPAAAETVACDQPVVAEIVDGAQSAAASLDTLIRQRRSIRAYDSCRMVSREVVERLVAAASQAPTARNRRRFGFRLYSRQETGVLEQQAQDYFVNQVDDPGLKDLIVYHHYQVLLGAPHVLCLYADRAMSDFDCGLLSQNLLLMGQAMGLGLCCNGIFRNAFSHNPQMANQARLESEPDWPLRMAFSLGYPASDIHYRKLIEREPYRLEGLPDDRQAEGV